MKRLTTMIATISAGGLCAASASAATLYNLDISRDRGGVVFNADTDDSNLVFNSAAPSGTSTMTWNVYSSGAGLGTGVTINYTDINDSTGGASTIDVSIGSVNVDGYSDESVRDGIWTGYAHTASDNGSGPTVTISGLNPGDEINLVLYHGHARWSGLADTAFTFGGVTKTASESTASSNMPLTEGETYVRFDGLVADINGEITGTFGNPTVGNVSNTGLLSGLQFEVVPEPGSLALLGLGGLLIASRRRRD